MRAAPEMVPSLDDALRALETAGINFPDYRTVTQFLAQLDDVRDVPAVVLDQLQAAALEGAYQAGFRCADESGHVLVVSLPALLAYVAPPRLSWGARFWRWFGALAAPCPPDCEECRPHGAYVGAREDAAIWKKRALEAEAKLRAQQLELVFAAPAAPQCTFPECVCTFAQMVAGCSTRRASLYGEKQHG